MKSFAIFAIVGVGLFSNPPTQSRVERYRLFHNRATNPDALARLGRETMGCRPNETGENTARFQIYSRSAGSTVISSISGQQIDSNPIPEAERPPKYFEISNRVDVSHFAALSQNGTIQKISDHLNKIIVVFLFKPDCKYTTDMIDEIIRLQGMQQQLGVVVLPVTLGNEGWGGLSRWRQKNLNAIPAEFSIYQPSTESGTGASAFGPLFATPTTFILDRKGRIAWRMSGAMRGAIWDRLNQILLEPDSATTTPAIP